MTRKTTSNQANPPSRQPLPHLARESAEQIWLAGLGAFAKAQQEGGKVFSALVQDGMALQKQAQAVAQEHLREAGERMGHLASGVGAKAAAPLDKLEGLFEDRVAKALQRLGVPTSQDLQQLRDQIDALTRELQQNRAAASAPSPARKRTTRGDKDAS